MLRLDVIGHQGADDAHEHGAETAFLATGVRRRRDRRKHHAERLYHVPLSADDLRLIQACSTWICRLQPAPDIRARFLHLEQQLACAQPALTTGPDQESAATTRAHSTGGNPTGTVARQK